MGPKSVADNPVQVEVCGKIFPKYCLVTGFGLMIGFIGLFDTAHDCTLQLTVTHTH
jgi:hypothetical protein